MNELWKEICFTLNDIPNSCNEDVYEQKIIQVLALLGWSSVKEEIILRKSYQLGSSGTIIPDIIVKSLDKNESFVIEVKKPSLDVENESHKNQLFSYMRQLKLEYGLLIGNKIQVYYDSKNNTEEYPVLVQSIEILNNNEKNLVFINLFKKELFSYETLEKFAKKRLEELASKNHQKKLFEKLISNEYKNKLEEFIINDLQENWDIKTITDTMNKLSISILEKKENISSTNIANNNVKTRNLNYTRNKKDKFEEWLIQNGKKQTTAKQYSGAINSISKHYLEETSQNIDIYQIEDIKLLAEIRADYIQTGRFSQFGQQGNGTNRNAIARYEEYIRGGDY